MQVGYKKQGKMVYGSLMGANVLFFRITSQVSSYSTGGFQIV